MEFVSVLERKNQLEALNVSEELIPLIMRWDDKHIATYIYQISEMVNSTNWHLWLKKD